MQNLSISSIRHESEYWLVRNFLRDAWQHTEDKTLNWHPARLDYNRWHMFANCLEQDLLPLMHIGRIKQELAGVFIPDSPGGYMLQIHPDFDAKELTDSLMDYFEQVMVREHKIKRAHIPAEKGDKIMESALAGKGFRPSDWFENRREAVLLVMEERHPLPTGFIIRSLGEENELPERSWASWRAFHPDEPDSKYEGWEWYRNIQKCPLYRRDLDLVAVSPDSRIASFATFWYDDYNRTGYIDPVGTVPEYWRKGLGKAVLSEGFSRLCQLGALRVYIESYEEPAHQLYEKIGLKTVKLMRTWTKEYT